MEEMLNYLTRMPDTAKLLWLVFWLSLASLAEIFIPLTREPYNRWQHLKVNGFFLLSTLAINSVFGLLLLTLLPVFQNNSIGLFYHVSLPVWLELLVALLILDLLAQYTIHYLLHNVKWMWRFHSVHHSDTHVDATTGTRHHPVDYFTRESFSLLTVAMLGVPLSYYLFYRLLTVVCTYFTHSNIKLPDNVDRALSFVIITPRAHKFHHHYKMPWTDRNFGNIFVFWDRLFGTFVYDDIEKVRYGVDTMEDAQADNITYQLIKPFRR